MAAECAGGGKLTELVADHVFGHIDGDELVAVVNGESVSHEVGRDHGGAAPGLDDTLLTALVHGCDLLLQLYGNKGSFFKRTTHTCLRLIKLFFPSFNDILRRVLLGRASLQTLCVETRARAGMSTRLTALTTTHRVVYRVHYDTSVVRTTAEPAAASCLA